MDSESLQTAIRDMMKIQDKFLRQVRYGLIIVSVSIIVGIVQLSLFTGRLEIITDSIQEIERNDERIITKVKSIGILPDTQRQLNDARDRREKEFERVWDQINIMRQRLNLLDYARLKIPHEDASPTEDKPN
jgi:hypothetical protein